MDVVGGEYTGKLTASDTITYDRRQTRQGGDTQNSLACVKLHVLKILCVRLKVAR